MKRTFKIALLVALSVGSASLNAYRFDVSITKAVADAGTTLRYTRKVSLGGFKSETYVPQFRLIKRYESKGLCLWGSQFDIIGGAYAGEKIIIPHSDTSTNHCSGRSFLLGTAAELKGSPKSSIKVGQQGRLAVRMTNI